MATTWHVFTTYALDDVFGYRSANRIVNNMLNLGQLRAVYPLGGSRNNALTATTSTALNAYDYLDIELDGSNLGEIVQARVECQASSTANAFVPKIRNVTDNTDAGTGTTAYGTSANYGATGQMQTITVSLSTAGAKKYRLQIEPLTTAGNRWTIGYLERYVTS